MRSESLRYILVAYGTEGTEESKNKIMIQFLDAFKRINKRRVNVGFILDRGDEFAPFLDRLLAEIAKGKPLGLSWLKVRPQDIGGGAPQLDPDPGPFGIVVL